MIFTVYNMRVNNFMSTERDRIKQAYYDTLHDPSRYASFMLVLFYAFYLTVFILNEKGYFYVDKSLFRYCTFISLVLFAVPYILCRIKHKINSRVLMYVVIGCSFLFAVCATTILSFHAALLVLFPMLISLIYYNKEAATCGIVASVITAVLSSYLMRRLNTMDLEYAAWIVYSASHDELSPNSQYLNSILSHNYYPLKEGLFIYYALPNAFILTGYYVIVRGIMRFRSRQHAEANKEISKMQNQVLYAMSDIVENRDVSTGGHVKRTTDVVAILVSNIDFSLDEYGPNYDEYVIKAAATHDLGKIAIDDDILKKPGKLTKEEFEQIKIHPGKSEQIIDQMLTPIENPEFMKVARNLARYHHERYDGTGYPDGLKGEKIPLEARIMTIADVYDALVSKRCYKNPISHEEACNIIRESMGTQFDPLLHETFERSTEQLKKYYEE